MNYILMPSLEHVALVKTAITLWNQVYIMILETDFSNEDKMLDTHEKGCRVLKTGKEWMEIEERVLENVLQLPLPKCLKDKLSCVIEPIGLELFDWLTYYFKKYHMILPNRLCWTPQGTIDKKKTAEKLVRDENITLSKRYILACDNCLEEDIRYLWGSMSKSNEAIFNNSDNSCNPVDLQTDFVIYVGRTPIDNQLVAFWTNYITGKVTQLNNLMSEVPPYIFIHEYAEEGNKAPLEYFLKKLNPVEREECMTKYYIHPSGMGSSDVLCFLLSQMNEEQQIKYFRAYSCEVLQCLLKWPFQNFFMEMYATIHKLDLLDERKYMRLLAIILRKVLKGCKDWNYQELLQQIWQKSPTTHKIYVLEKWTGEYSSLLKNLAYQGNIEIILKNITAQEKRNIIFSSKRCCLNLMYNKMWTLLKSFIQECISSKDMMVEFKNEFSDNFEKMFKVNYLADKQNDCWYEFYLLLNKLIRNEDKKKKKNGGR